MTATDRRPIPAETEDRDRIRYLHRVRAIPSPMSAEVLARRMDALHAYLGDDAPGNGPGQTFGILVGRSETTVSLWRNGRRAIPRWVWVTANSLAALAEVVGRDGVLYAIMDGGCKPPSEWDEPRMVPDLRLRA